MTDLEFALKHTRTISYGKGVFPDVIPIDFGMDFHLETKPELYPEAPEKRSVRLIIETFQGYCPGAIHYYGKLEADGISIIKKETDKNGKVHKYSCGGYICEEFNNLENNAFYQRFYNFEILHELTQEEINLYSERWRGYKPGYMTSAFLSLDELIEIAKIAAKERFPEWNFEIKEY